MPLDDETALARMAQGLNLRFVSGEVFLDDVPVGDAIRTEEAGRTASKIAALPALRAALLDLQRPRQRDVAIEVPLVKFIEHQRVYPA